MTRHPFTAEQERWLAENYPVMGTTVATEEFNRAFGQNRSWDTIRTHCKRKGYRCNAEVLSRRGRNNKGTYLPIGSVITDTQGYKHIKVAETKRKADNYELLHRHIWEAANGKVPDDCYLIFLDGDRNHCELSNLALIKKGYITLMMKYGMRSEFPEVTRTAIEWCRLHGTLNEWGNDNVTRSSRCKNSR